MARLRVSVQLSAAFLCLALLFTVLFLPLHWRAFSCTITLGVAGAMLALFEYVARADVTDKDPVAIHILDYFDKFIKSLCYFMCVLGTFAFVYTIIYSPPSPPEPASNTPARFEHFLTNSKSVVHRSSVIAPPRTQGLRALDSILEGAQSSVSRLRDKAEQTRRILDETALAIETWVISHKHASDAVINKLNDRTAAITILTWPNPSSYPTTKSLMCDYLDATMHSSLPVNYTLVPLQYTLDRLQKSISDSAHAFQQDVIFKQEWWNWRSLRYVTAYELASKEQRDVVLEHLEALGNLNGELKGVLVECAAYNKAFMEAMRYAGELVEVWECGVKKRYGNVGGDEEGEQVPDAKEKVGGIKMKEIMEDGTVMVRVLRDRVASLKISGK